jgi:hypothetical protein
MDSHCAGAGPPVKFDSIKISKATMVNFTKIATSAIVCFTPLSHYSGAGRRQNIDVHYWIPRSGPLSLP